ncbi:hypothetical protein [Terriglobus albidus]|nr:hypothetical protein [Terriglobus albidus]
MAEANALKQGIRTFGAKWLRYAQRKDGAEHDPPCYPVARSAMSC